MSRIASATVYGLGGSDRVVRLTFEGPVTVLWGLNGSGKTSLLRILHAALQNSTRYLSRVPFDSAEIEIQADDGRIVEGTVLDRSFYDSLFSENKHTKDMNANIYLAAEIGSPKANVSASGKQAVMKLHEHYKKKNLLAQSTNSGTKLMVFMVDRDFDNIIGTKKRSIHIAYTANADVEAEILNNCDLTRSIKIALSVSERDAALLAARVGKPGAGLATLWRDWITLCCLALAVDARSSVKPSLRSGINVDVFGSVDPVKYQAKYREVATRARRAVASREKFVRGRIAGTFSRGEHHLLPKGKWLTSYVQHQLEGTSVLHSADWNGFSASFTHVALSTLDFSAGWAAPLHKQLNDLVVYYSPAV